MFKFLKNERYRNLIIVGAVIFVAYCIMGYNEYWKSKTINAIIDEVKNLKENDIINLVDKNNNILVIDDIALKGFIECLKTLKRYDPEHPLIIRSINLITERNDLKIVLCSADEFGKRTGFIEISKPVGSKPYSKYKILTCSSQEFEKWFFGFLEKQ